MIISINIISIYLIQRVCSVLYMVEGINDIKEDIE